MIKHKKLEEWTAQGLLSPEQASAIHDYEQARKGGRFGRGVMGLGVFAILVGILSVIAANWAAIPPTVKIGAHVLLNAAVACAALWADRKGRADLREYAALAFFGLTFTLIILIGQVYQLDGSAADATLLWTAVTFPFLMIMGRGLITAVPWMLVFLMTLTLNVIAHFSKIPVIVQPTVIVSLMALLPLLMIGAGGAHAFQSFRPAIAGACLRLGIVLITFSASFNLAAYHIMNRFPGEYHLLWFYYAPVLLAGLALIGLHAALHRFYRDDLSLKSGALFVAVSFAASFIPLLLQGIGGSLAAALLFIAYWIFTGWTAQKFGLMRAVSLSITIIAIRIFIIYVEVFGTLFDTGLGLIVGGVVVIALISAAKRLNTRLVRKGGNHVTA